MSRLARGLSAALAALALALALALAAPAFGQEAPAPPNGDAPKGGAGGFVERVFPVHHGPFLVLASH